MRRVCGFLIFLVIPILCFGVIELPKEGETVFSIKSENGVSDYFILTKPEGVLVSCSISGDSLDVVIEGISGEGSSGILKITAIDSSGRTGVFETVLISTPFKKPEIKSIKPSSDGIHISWSSSSKDCLGYDLYRDGSVIKSNLMATQYFDRDVNVLQSHCYKVSAVFEEGECFSEEKCAEGLSSVTEQKVFPNPAKEKVVFTGLDCGWELVILNVSCEVVFSVKAEDKAYTWYLLNNSGKKVSSGIYYYLLKSPSGSVEKTGKLAIVK
ncbi:MAG: hypothetical protein PHV06_06605 [bacterium]|nr:hypothetical protein [bacterium]